VVGYLPATINLYDGDVTRRQQVFSATGLTLGKNRWVLYKP